MNPAIESWTTEAGYQAEIREGMALCGYVGITDAHPHFRKEYGEVDRHYDVHGGLTYSAERDGVWWFGFDTAHFGDAFLGVSGVKRDAAYVRDECERLAKQLRAVQEKHWEPYTRTATDRFREDERG